MDKKKIVSDKNKPLFLIPPGHEIVINWKGNFQKLEQSQDVLTFSVNPSIVEEGQVAWIQQMVMALQHYPHLIERMIFAVGFNFLLADDVPVSLKDDEWKMKPEVYRWFHAMSNLPIVIFFITDQDARAYCLIGDELASGKFKYHYDTDGRHQILEFTDKQVQLIADRLFHSSWAMLMYCHATGFNPDKYIDALLADYDMPFTAADVRKKYEQDIERGIEFRMVVQP